jgi:DNA topoisomerase-2
MVSKKHGTPKVPVNMTATQVKNQLHLFINCQIEDPSFDSQSKDTLTTHPRSYGSVCTISDRVLKEVLSTTGIEEKLVEMANAKYMSELAALAKKTGGGSRRHMLHIPKVQYTIHYASYTILTCCTYRSWRTRTRQAVRGVRSAR